MTVSALGNTRAQVLGDGVSDRVDLEFQFVDENDLQVIHTDAEGVTTEWAYQEAPGNWSFTGGNYNTGTVIFSAGALQPGDYLTVTLTSRYDQPFTLAGGEIDPAVIQRSLDKTALAVQAIAGRAERSLSVSSSLKGALPALEVPDLPDGYTFVRQGDALVPALIDSAAISQAVSEAQDHKQRAETAATSAKTSETRAQAAQGAAETAQTAAETAVTEAQTARMGAQTERAKAEAARDATEVLADEIVADATQVLGAGRVPVGAALPWMSDVPPNQFWVMVKEAGQTFSRTLFPQLLNVYAPERTVTITAGSAVITGIGAAQGFAPGMAVEGVGIPAGTTIQSIDAASQLTLSAPASADGTSCRVFRFGNGDGATTAHFPDFAGRYLRGWDPSGAVNVDAAGALGGTQEDAIPDHGHELRGGGGAARTLGTQSSILAGAEGIQPGNFYTNYLGSEFVGAPIDRDTKLALSTASETRPKTLLICWIVKVADGVDDAATLQALHAVQGIAQAQTDIVSLKSDLASTERQLIGVGQTWQDVATSRSTNIAYQNTTGRPIQVAVSLSGSGSTAGSRLLNFELSPDGTSWSTIATACNNANSGGGCTVVVPAALFYRVTLGGSSGANSWNRWWELR